MVIRFSGVCYDSYQLNMLIVLTLHITLVEMKFAKKNVIESTCCHLFYYSKLVNFIRYVG